MDQNTTLNIQPGYSVSKICNLGVPPPSSALCFSHTLVGPLSLFHHVSGLMIHTEGVGNTQSTGSVASHQTWCSGVLLRYCCSLWCCMQTRTYSTTGPNFLVLQVSKSVAWQLRSDGNVLLGPVFDLQSLIFSMYSGIIETPPLLILCPRYSTLYCGTIWF